MGGCKVLVCLSGRVVSLNKISLALVGESVAADGLLAIAWFHFAERIVERLGFRLAIVEQMPA
jgi:hypothetical protein